jgi:phospholipase/carboxylesterase
MKRLQFAAVAPGPIHVPSPVFAGPTFPAPPDIIEHSLFVPLHYEKNYSYPLIVWLHSDGDNHRQLKRIMPLVSLRNYVAIAPRGASCEFGDDGAAGWPQAEGDIIDAQWRATQSVEIAQSRYNINPSRIFIGGYAEGGTMALRLALRMPQLFAGVFSIGGGLPQGHAPLVNVHNARGLAVMLAHGNASEQYSTARLCGDLRLIHSAGLAAHVRQYPCGDELTTQMLSDVNHWLMERVTGSPSADGPVAADRRERN